MPLQLQSYDITIARDGIELTKALDAGEYDTHRVVILHADSLVAEQAGPRYGLPDLKAAPLGYTTLWCWAALKRMGITVPEFPLFKGQVISVDPVKPETDVDPTIPRADTGSP